MVFKLDSIFGYFTMKRAGDMGRKKEKLAVLLLVGGQEGASTKTLNWALTPAVISFHSTLHTRRPASAEGYGSTAIGYKGEIDNLLQIWGPMQFCIPLHVTHACSESRWGLFHFHRVGW